jgi:hypothetical protein
MDVLALVIVVLLVALVVVTVSAPLRGGAAVAATHDSLQRADLEAAKEAKYAEIRDAEMDFRTGKLSDADWGSQDRELRAEAIELLRRLDALGPDTGEGAG